MASGNTTIICQDPHFFVDKSIWELGSSITSPTSLFFLQTSMIAIVSQCISLFLKPLGQSTIVSQILGGILFGPSVLGHNKGMANTLFPMKGAVVIETAAVFGVMFCFFLVGVQMDPVTLLKTERKAITLGLSVAVFSLVLPVMLSLVFRHHVSMDYTLRHCLPFLAASQSFTAFPVIACLLTELKILNTDIGRLALSTAMVADIIGLLLMVIIFAVLENKHGNIVSLICILLSAAALLLVILYVLRPAIKWMFKRCEDGKDVDEIYIISIFLFVLITGILSEVIGQHYFIGPLLLGLAVPEGPPIGSTLIAKLETFALGFFYPLYLAVSGLQTNLFKVNLQSMWIVGILVIFASLVKIGAVMLPGYYTDIPMKECYVIGLILNARGIAELVIYNLWKGSTLLTDQEFTLMVISVVAVTAVITPLIRYLYDPSEQYYSLKRSSIQHSKRQAGLQIMVCIHNTNRENIFTIINLLEASCASKESTVGVIALILVELLGRTRPILVAHQHHETLPTTSSNSNQLENALKQYELHNDGCASVQSFTSFSNYETMDDDVCRIALDRKANILIMPFHKQWEIDGGVEIINRAIQGINTRVLEKAPCSVGILIDRGILSGSVSLLTARTAYHVAVFFIGGADDAEALAYGARMARHGSVDIKVVRFLLFGEENSKSRKRESDLIDEYRQVNMRNMRFEIMDVVVRDGLEMSSVIRRLIDSYDLVMVGREHPESTLLKGHDQWSECPELGIIGDMLSSPDFLTKASVLVVQQQRIRGKTITHTLNSKPNERDQLVHDVPDEQTSESWTIYMDK